MKVLKVINLNERYTLFTANTDDIMLNTMSNIWDMYGNYIRAIENAENIKDEIIHVIDSQEKFVNFIENYDTLAIYKNNK